MWVVIFIAGIIILLMIALLTAYLDLRDHVLGKIDDCYILEHDCPCCGISVRVSDDRKYYL